MDDPELAQGFADTVHACWRMPFLNQQGPYFDVRGASRSVEPRGVLVVCVAGQECLASLCEGIFHFRRAASPAPRAGWSVAPWWALQAGSLSFQAARPPTWYCGHAFVCWCGIPSGAFGVRGVRLVVRIPISAWELVE